MSTGDGRSIEALPVSPSPEKIPLMSSTDRGQRTRAKIIEVLADPWSRRKTQKEIAARVGVTDRALRMHFKADPSIHSEARELYRRLYVPKEMLGVDRVALQRAQEGDIPAMKLCYRVHDGVGDREDISAGQELIVNIRCEDDFSGLAQEMGIRIRPARSDAP